MIYMYIKQYTSTHNIILIFIKVGEAGIKEEMSASFDIICHSMVMMSVL